MTSKGKLSRIHFPDGLDHPEVKGVFIGGCVERGVGSKFRAKAHAHTKGFHRGWVCFRSDKWIGHRLLCLHEFVHIVTREGHTDRWQKFLLQIGGTLEAVPGVMRSYEKRVRQ